MGKEKNSEEKETKKAAKRTKTVQNLNENEKNLKLITSRLISILKRQKSYNPLLQYQAEHCASLMVIAQRIRAEIFDGGEDFVEEVISREGNSRAKQNPLYQLYLQYMDRIQDSLKALGMNVDSKPVKKEDRGMEEFIERFSEDD